MPDTTADTPESIRIVRRFVGGRTFEFQIGDNYQARVAQQTEDCRKGEHWHNPVENECCGCFGCCVPTEGSHGR